MKQPAGLFFKMSSCACRSEIEKRVTTNTVSKHHKSFYRIITASVQSTQDRTTQKANTENKR